PHFGRHRRRHCEKRHESKTRHEFSYCLLYYRCDTWLVYCNAKFLLVATNRLNMYGCRLLIYGRSFSNIMDTFWCDFLWFVYGADYYPNFILYANLKCTESVVMDSYF